MNGKHSNTAVGARLFWFPKNFATITDEPWVLSSVFEGLIIVFFSKAVQLSNYSSVGMSNGMVVVCDVCDICDEEGQRLFAKRAITEIKDNSLSLFVTFSVFLKKKGSGHFIVNLKSLNSFIRYKHKIENLDLLRFIVREDD